MIYPQPDWLTKDEHGILMPWYTRPCLEWLDTIDLKDKLVFEYGCGYSTLWYKSRNAEVYGVDDNERWALLSGSSLQISAYEYIHDLTDYGTRFDIIIVDGILRDQCAVEAMNHLKSGGYLIIDNWDQPSVEPNDWTLTKRAIEVMKYTVYKEPGHPDWHTLVIQMP